MSWWRIQIFDSNKDQIDEQQVDVHNLKKTVEDLAEENPENDYVCTPVDHPPVPDPYSPPELE